VDIIRITSHSCEKSRDTQIPPLLHSDIVDCKRIQFKSDSTCSSAARTMSAVERTGWLSPTYAPHRCHPRPQRRHMSLRRCRTASALSKVEVMGLELWVQDKGFRVQGLRFRV